MDDRRASRPAIRPTGSALPRRGAAPAAGYAHITRARCVAVAGLAAIAAAVAIIFISTVGRSPSTIAPIAVRAATKPRFWIVRPGQSLASIAARERIGLRDVERLNPHLVPGSLVSGQRVRLP